MQATALTTCLGVGAIVNHRNANWFQLSIEHISPTRWMYEILMNRSLSDRSQSQHDVVLNYIGFESGYAMCYLALCMFWVAFFFLTWAVYVMKAKVY